MTLAVAVLALAPAPQLLKQVDVDRFNTPYTVGVTGIFGDVHDWYGLTRDQCLFYRRGTYLVVNANPNNTVLTFQIGNGQMTFTSPKQIFWEFHLYYFTKDGTTMDLSRVKRFYVDVDHIPDIAAMYAYDKWYNSGGASPLGQLHGIYFNKSSFGTNLDWKNIYNIEFQLDFSSMPNPLSVNYSRIYLTLEPGLSGPGSKVQPTGFGG
jgi:hypothetical protein